MDEVMRLFGIVDLTLTSFLRTYVVEHRFGGFDYEYMKHRDERGVHLVACPEDMTLVVFQRFINHVADVETGLDDELLRAEFEYFEQLDEVCVLIDASRMGHRPRIFRKLDDVYRLVREFNASLVVRLVLHENDEVVFERTTTVSSKFRG